MSQPGERAFEEFDAAYWEDRYRNSVGAAGHDPSPSLATLTSEIRPGRALDAGCGTGGDALWLAAHGWHVTALDVSPTALEQGRESARVAGPAFAERIEWVQADLTLWQPGRRAFDLVTSHFVHVPGPPEALVRRLAAWVAPGGTLLVVGHAGGNGHGHGHTHPPGAQVRAEQIVAGLPDGQWNVVAESRTHTIRRPDSAVLATRDDIVVHAQRRITEADPSE